MSAAPSLKPRSARTNCPPMGMGTAVLCASPASSTTAFFGRLACFAVTMGTPGFAHYSIGNYD
jgi:hypothetical protein